RVQQNRERRHEDECRDGVRLPALLLLGARPDEAVEAALGGRQPTRHPQRARVDAGHVRAERIRENGEETQVDGDLGDAVAGHSFSPRNRTYTRYAKTSSATTRPKTSPADIR